MAQQYDAILVVAFGGPEGPEDVIPFLENVLRGRNVPRERLREVAEHYDRFGGVSPLNAQVRELIAALRGELDRYGIDLPLYHGNRNWHPLLPDTMRRMAADGVRRALAVVLAGYSSYSSCRQYLENIEAARRPLGERAPVVEKVRAFYNHPEFIAAAADRLSEALRELSTEKAGDSGKSPASDLHVAYTAHSIPLSMARQCDYEQQLTETCRLVSEALSIPAEQWKLVYQSRSGRPQDPWLEPDICDHLAEAAAAQEISRVAIMPVGFLSDHIEVLYDLDVEARRKAEQLGLKAIRAKTVGTHPRFVAMLRELIQERLDETRVRRAIGRYGPHHDLCPADCCPPPSRST